MGGKKKPTIGYWYRYLIHFGLGQVLDALLEMRGGDRTAWSGRAEGGTIAINARELWGGEKAEGGIEGELDVMLGHADQMPSDRLAAQLGDQQSAYRGRSTVAFEGLYGAFNPYPKAPAFKGVRIFEGWEDETCWYPDKAAIPMGFESVLPTSWLEGGFSAHPFGQLVDAGTTYPGPNEWTAQMADFYGLAYEPVGQPLFFWRANESGLVYSKQEEGVSNNVPMVAELIDRGWLPNQTAVIQYYLSTNLAVSVLTLGATSDPPPAPAGYAWSEQGDSPMSTTLGTVRLWGAALFAPTTTGPMTFYGMNPAHILYDSLTHSTMQGEPIDAVDEPSFAASADLFFFEGFGLCTKFNPVSESAEAFQRRICSVVGANLARSRINGKYYLIPVRGVHDLDALPVLEDDDILEYEEEPSDPLESVNQVSVEWFDPVKKKKRTTTPLQSLGSIQSTGGIIAEVASYPEIPAEELALKAAARDLAQKAPLKRFRLTTNRVPYAWRAGDYFRLQAPRRGIADMVCMVGEIDAGTPRSGSMRLVAIQDVSGMPSTVYVSAEPGVDTSPSQVPGIPEAQQLLEAPYVDLAGDLSASELSALTPDVGFVLAVASRPSAGLNYTLFTAADGETLADRGSGDWCPTALIVEAGVRDPGETAFTFGSGQDLELVEVGTAALWGEEVVRVDALDIEAGTLSLGRGCADTPPQLHAAGERIWFYDSWASSDRREYAGGETMTAKLRTRTPSQLLDESLAPTLTLGLDERAVRPYAPGALAITDLLATAAVNPSACFGELTASWAHRDRLLQGDQLVDAAGTDVGPEAGTTYTIRYYLDDVLDGSEAGLTATSATPYTPTGDGLLRIEVDAVRDGFVSWKPAVAEFTYALEPYDTRISDAGDVRISDAGDTRITE